MSDNYSFTELTISAIRPYSIGIAAQNLKMGSKMLEVTPIQDLNEINGEINDQYQEISYEVQTLEEGAKTSKTKHTNTITAEWLPKSQSNRLTPPNIRRNERLMIYQLGDSQTYYWATLFDDLYLRRLETVIYTFSNTTDESVTQLTADNTYFFEVSTHKGLTGFYTSKSNGEAWAYTIQLNAKEGYFTVKDDAGNYIHLNSKDHRIMAQNDKQSKVELIDDVVNTYSVKEVNIDTKACTVNCESATINASKTTINSETEINGVLKVNAVLKANQGIEVKGVVKAADFIEVIL